MKKSEEEIIKEMQEVVGQMIIDDMDENPDMADEYFSCDCCGQNKCLAGSIQYEHYRLCNDCVLLAETGFALGKFKHIQELIDKMEDKRLEADCKFLKEQEEHQANHENN